MNKTLYLKDEDGPIWDEARKLAGDKLSRVVVSALKRYISEKAAKAKGFGRIVVEYNDYDANRLMRKKAFQGRWVFSPEDPIFVIDRNAKYGYAVAETIKGAVVCYYWLLYKEKKVHEWFQTFSSFEEGARSTIPATAEAVRMAFKERGVEIEELEI